MKIFQRRQVSTMLLSGTILLSLPVSAVEEQNSMVLEEVIVTARKRAESMQETPVAISAFSGDKLTEAGIGNLGDLGQVVPNMDVVNGNGTSGKGSIFIRGVGQRNTGIQIDSGVGIYLDDVYIARADGALLDTTDIASVQVLRGPQGTLFGKNTTGGAVLFKTNRPQEKFEGKVMARAGNYDRSDVEVVVNVPLTDTLFTRFSGAVVKRDGYMKNVVDGKKYTDENRTSGIAQLRWLASDTVTVDLNVNYAETDQMTRGQRCQIAPGVVGWQVALREPLFQGAFGKSGGELCAESQALDSDEFMSDLVTTYYSENTGASGTVEWEINDSLVFKSVTAWRNTESRDDSDLDAIRAPLLANTDSLHKDAKGRNTDQYSQEFQLLGEALDGKINWVTGLFYFEEEGDSRRVGLLGPWQVANLGPAGQIINYASSSTGLEAKNSASAVFAQMDWALSDNWELTLGLRYTDEERELTRTRWLGYVPETITTGGSLIPVGSGTWLMEAGSFNIDYDFLPPVSDPDLDYKKVNNDDWSPTVSLKYLFEGGDFVNGGSAYFTYSQGFMSGGISEGPRPGLDTFEAEEVENFELGVKVDAWEQRLRVNAALFYTDYTNRQLTSIAVNPVLGSVAGITINADSTTISGLELETTLLATENLELTFNATWNDGDIDSFDDVQLQLNTGNPGCIPALGGAIEQCDTDRSDENVPRLADSSYYLAAQYTLRTGVGTFIPRISWSIKNDVEHCFDRSSCVSGLWLSDEEEDLSARITWLSNDEKWMVVAYGTNLQDNDFANGGVPLVDGFGFGGLTTAPPRMYGVEMHYNW